MVLLLTDVFLLLTQVLLWLVVGLITWFVLLRALPKAFLGTLVLILILVVLALSFISGPPRDGGVLEILWRIISFPFTPLGLGLILLLLLLSGTKLAKFTRNAISIALVILALGTLPVVAYYLAQELEMEAIEFIRPLPALTDGGRRVIVLLGQGTTQAFLRPRQEPLPSPAPRSERPISEDAFQVLSQLPVQLTDKGDRIIYAAQLYREQTAAGTNPLIVVSAGTRPNRVRKEGERREDISEARDIQNFLTTTLNVPETAILLEHDGNTIRRSAERVRQLLSDQQIAFGNQVTLVATAMNTNRAALTFERVFDDVTINVRPTDFHAIPPAGSLAPILQGRDLVEYQLQATDFLPSAEAFYVSSAAIDEYISSIYYFLRGWIRPLAPPR